MKGDIIMAVNTAMANDGSGYQKNKEDEETRVRAKCLALGVGRGGVRRDGDGRVGE